MKNWKPFQGKCPSCKSSDLEYGSIEPADEQIKQDVSCKGCRQDFAIWTKTEWEVEIKAVEKGGRKKG